MSLNKVLLIGNVGREPEVKYVAESKVATFSVATSEKYKERGSGQVKENTEWHTVVAWRNQAEFVEKYIHSGSQVYIEGQIKTRKWKDQSGADRYSTEIQAQSVQLLGKREGSSSQEGPI